jgi:transketolase
MKIAVLADAAAVAQKAAAIITGEARAAVAARGRFIVAVSGGHTSTFGWERYVGTSGRIIGMKTFGASAPLKELQRKFGFEPDQVAAATKAQLGRK